MNRVIRCIPAASSQPGCSISAIGPLVNVALEKAPRLRRSSRGAALLILSSCLTVTTISAAEPVSRLLRPTALDREVDAAVARAVTFLLKQQRPNGGWSIDQYQGESTSAASLVMMACLAAGHVPGDTPYDPALQRGLQYVLHHQRPDGMLIDKHGHGPLYCHGISTLFLAEIAGMTRGEQATACRQALERGVTLILDVQDVDKASRHAGGWRYLPQSNDSDLSVTAWQLLALRAAKNVGCDIPADAIDRAVSYVKQCSPSNGRGFAYQPGQASSPNMTAAGITALQVCGLHDDPLAVNSVDFLRHRLPRPAETYYFYGAYYSAVALHHHGGEAWEQTQPNLFRELLSRQQPDGGWALGNNAEAPLGRVYSTSLAVLALTVEYGYLPIYQK